MAQLTALTDSLSRCSGSGSSRARAGSFIDVVTRGCPSTFDCPSVAVEGVQARCDNFWLVLQAMGLVR